MRIAIVNDSPVAQEVLKQIIFCKPGYKIAWTAWNGQEAVKRCVQDRPDLILMDLLMPVMDGVEATRRIMAQSPCPILIVTASVYGRSVTVFEALGAGAMDAIRTPVISGGCEGHEVQALLKKIETIGLLTTDKVHSIGDLKESVVPCRYQETMGFRPIVAIGASTGGPDAILRVLSVLPFDFPAPLVVVQHMEPRFLQGFVSWLNEQIELPVKVALEGMEPFPGKVFVAHTNMHLVLNGRLRFAYQECNQAGPFCPSVDLFFLSLARNWPWKGVAFLLTGMGRDGAQGLLELQKKGWCTAAQDKDSCAVYGMPKAAVELGAAKKILSTGEMGQLLLRYFSKRDKGREDSDILAL